MKTRTFAIALMLFIMLSQIPVSALSGDDLIAVVKANIQAINSGQYEQALASYAEDGVVYNPLGVFVGKVEISKWLEQEINTSQVHPSDIKIVGNMVVATGTVLLKRFQQAGIGEVKFQAEYLVEQGKIRFFAPAITLTPEQQAKMKVAQANVTPAATPTVDPIEVAKSYVEATNSGDFEKAMSFYMENSAVLVVNSTVLLSSKDQIAKWLKTDFQTTKATPDDWQAIGNTVTATGTVSLERFKKLGVDPIQYRAIYVVENNKIRFFRPFAILTPEQQATVAAAQGTKTP